MSRLVPLLLALLVALAAANLALTIHAAHHPVRVLICGREGEGCQNTVETNP